MSTRSMLMVAGITLAALAVASRIPGIRKIVLGSACIGTGDRTGPSGLPGATPLPASQETMSI